MTAVTPNNIFIFDPEIAAVRDAVHAIERLTAEPSKLPPVAQPIAEAARAAVALAREASLAHGAAGQAGNAAAAGIAEARLREAGAQAISLARELEAAATPPAPVAPKPVSLAGDPSRGSTAMHISAPIGAQSYDVEDLVLFDAFAAGVAEGKTRARAIALSASPVSADERAHVIGGAAGLAFLAKWALDNAERHHPATEHPRHGAAFKVALAKATGELEAFRRRMERVRERPDGVTGECINFWRADLAEMTDATEAARLGQARALEARRAA
jgi:hypothetical protein